MKKLLLLLLILSPLMSSAAVDESKTDLYYANGMGIELSKLEVEKAWGKTVENLQKAKLSEGGGKNLVSSLKLF